MILRETIAKILIQVCFLITQLIVIGLFWNNNVALTSLYSLVAFMFCVFALMYPERCLADAFLLIIMILLFIPGERAMLLLGVYKYNNPGFLHVPIWIGFSWGFTAISIRHIWCALNNLTRSVLK